MEKKGCKGGSAGFMLLCLILAAFAGAACRCFGETAYGTESIFSAGSGSRACSMGSAFCALSDDSSGINYNPAGLINIPRQEVSLMHYPLAMGTLYDSVTYAQPLLDFGTIGAGICRVYTGGILAYDSSDVAAGESSFEEYRAALTFAKKIGDNVTAGVTAGLYSLSAPNVGSMAFGADMGLLYEPFSFLSLGFMCRNLLKPSLSWGGSKEELPQEYTAGALLKFGQNGYRINLAVDVSKSELINGVRPRAGIEAVILNTAALRAGYDDGRLSFGGGLKLWNLAFDYAYSPVASMEGLSRFTMSYNFGPTLEEQKKERAEFLKKQVKQLVEREFRKKESEKSKECVARALSMFKDGRYDEAQDEVDRAFEWSKDNPDAASLRSLIGKKLVSTYYGRALKAYDRGDIVPAFEGFKKVCSLDRDYKDAGVFMEKIEQKMKMKSSAKVFFTKGVEQYVSRQYEDAIASLNKARDLEPGNPVIKTYLDKASLQLRQQNGGRELTGEQADRVKRLYQAGLKSYTAGDLRAAMASWKSALEINPGDIKVLKSIEKVEAEIVELQKIGMK